MQHYDLTEEEKKLIINDYQNGLTSVAKLALKYHKSDYKIRSALQEIGVYRTYIRDLDLMALDKQTPCYTSGIWKAPQIYVKSVNRYYYDITEAPLTTGFSMFGVDSPNKCKFPKWKIALQKQWEETNGEYGVNYAYQKG